MTQQEEAAIIIKTQLVSMDYFSLFFFSCQSVVKLSPDDWMSWSQAREIFDGLVDCGTHDTNFVCLSKLIFAITNSPGDTEGELLAQYFALTPRH